MQDLDDADLVEAFLADRSEAAFRTLYRRHAPALLGLIHRLLGTTGRDAAEDVSQEAWLRAAERLARFRGESTLRTWLAGVAVHCCRERLRARPAAVAVSPPSEGARTGRPDLALDLDRLVAELPDGFREVLVLHDVEGHTHEEIGAFLGIEAATSRSQLARARRRLRERFAGARRADGGRA